MKRTTAIVFVLIVCSVWTTAQTPETFATFWKNFKTIVAKNDKEAVADITKLPFLYESQERDREGFIKIYPKLFTPKIRRCIATAKPTKEGENYDVFCGQLILYFGKDTDGKFKFLEFGVND